MYYGDSVGWDKVLAACEKYGKQLPNVSHWKPAPLLKELAQKKVSLNAFWMQKAKASRM